MTDVIVKKISWHGVELIITKNKKNLAHNDFYVYYAFMIDDGQLNMIDDGQLNLK